MAPSITLSTHQEEEEEQLVGQEVEEVEMIKVGESHSTERGETTHLALHHHRATPGSTSRSLTSNIPPVPATLGCR